MGIMIDGVSDRHSAAESMELDLPADSLSFLVEVGLPNEEILKQNGVHHTFFERIHFQEAFIENEKYIAVGKFADVDIYIYIKSGSAEVFATKKSSFVYMNSSIRNYMIFEQICRSEFYKVKAYEEAELIAAVEQMKKRFSDIEPKALMEDSYWDQYLFPYEIGFL